MEVAAFGGGLHVALPDDELGVVRRHAQLCRDLRRRRQRQQHAFQGPHAELCLHLNEFHQESCSELEKKIQGECPARIFPIDQVKMIYAELSAIAI